MKLPRRRSPHRKIRRTPVAKYLVHVSFKVEGIRQVLAKAKATGLRAAVTKLIEAAGGKLEAWYFAFGKDDVVGIVDLPDNIAMAALSVAANSAGFIGMSVTPLLTAEEMDKAIEKSGGLPVPGH
jgi:uncharacterized protein with GYD domain